MTPKIERSTHEGYHTFSGGHGSYEVFWADGDSTFDRGWHWWPCWPGCLPDGEATGPFTTSRNAYLDARN